MLIWSIVVLGIIGNIFIWSMAKVAGSADRKLDQIKKNTALMKAGE